MRVAIVGPLWSYNAGMLSSMLPLPELSCHAQAENHVASQSLQPPQTTIIVGGYLSPNSSVRPLGEWNSQESF